MSQIGRRSWNWTWLPTDGGKFSPRSAAIFDIFADVERDLCMFEWKPIDTIPKNGEFHFCWNSYSDPDGDQIDMVAWRKGRWIFASGFANVHPTHWMVATESAKKFDKGTSLGVWKEISASLIRRCGKIARLEMLRRHTSEAR